MDDVQWKTAFVYFFSDIKSKPNQKHKKKIFSPQDRPSSWHGQQRLDWLTSWMSQNCRFHVTFYRNGWIVENYRLDECFWTIKFNKIIKKFNRLNWFTQTFTRYTYTFVHRIWETCVGFISDICSRNKNISLKEVSSFAIQHRNETIVWNGLALRRIRSSPIRITVSIGTHIMYVAFFCAESVFLDIWKF